MGGLRKELAVLCVEESAEAWKIIGGDGVEERVVVCGHFVFHRESFRLLTSVYSLGLSKFQKECIRIMVTLGSEDR